MKKIIIHQPKTKAVTLECHGEYGKGSYFEKALWMMMEIKDIRNRMQPSSMYVYEAGNLMAVISQNRHQKLHGITSIFDQEGKLQEIRNYCNGKLDSIKVIENAFIKDTQYFDIESMSMQEGLKSSCGICGKEYFKKIHTCEWKE